MSSVETTVSTNLLAHIYRGEFKFSNLHHLRSQSLRTAPFFPMPNIKLGFCFEISYLNYTYDIDFILIKLKLLALCAYDIPETMKLRLNVGLNSNNGFVLHRFRLSPALTTDEMKSVYFDDLVYTHHETKKCLSLLRQHNSFIVLCEMEFFNHLNVPSAYNHFKPLAANDESLPKFDELSDISINIGEMSLPAHKAVLVAHSPVFRNMFSHDFEESSTNTITISDSTFEVFQCFLKYLYSGEVEDKSWPSAKELYALADKYDVLSLKQLAGEIISSQISLENVCGILNLAFVYDDDKIKKEAIGFAVIHLRELLPKNEWKELVAKHPRAGYEAAVSYSLQWI